MSSLPAFAEIDALQKEWRTLQPLAEDHERRLWRKLRLEWNYHSNHIEGNTLTYGETELLLLHGRTSGDHPLRDFEEMKAHDLGIEHLRLLAADSSRTLTEGDIRDLNRIILKEPYWKSAQTADGQPSRKQIIPGQYKSTPNNVLTATGELFEFASPEETAPRVHDLVHWLNQQLSSAALHPIIVAAKLHHEFILIHPFDDGNGRVARLLTNYVLMRAGFPPVVIKSEEKAAYLSALRKADAGEIEALVEHLVAASHWSLLLGIRAAKGESIEEMHDVDKEIALYVRAQQAARSGEPLPTTGQIEELLQNSFAPLLEKVAAKLFQLAPLFNAMQVVVQDQSGEYSRSTRLKPFEFESSLRRHRHSQVVFSFHTYQGGAPIFDHAVLIDFHLPRSVYMISYNGKVLTFPYSQPLAEAEANRIANELLSDAFAEIKTKAGLQGD